MDLKYLFSQMTSVFYDTDLVAAFRNVVTRHNRGADHREPLLEALDRPFWQALVAACDAGQKELFAFLSFGPEENTHKKTREDGLQVDGFYLSPIALAAKTGLSRFLAEMLDIVERKRHDLEMPWYNLNHPGNIGQSPFLLACKHGHAGAARELQTRGANTAQLTRDYSSALHLAVAGGHLEVVQFLIETCDADAGVRDSNNRTPLSALMKFELPPEETDAILKLLVPHTAKHGATDYANNDGMTPLMHAVAAGYTNVDYAYQWAELLLEHGASPLLLSRYGKNAVHYARRKRTRALLSAWETKHRRNGLKDESSLLNRKTFLDAIRGDGKHSVVRHVDARVRLPQTKVIDDMTPVEYAVARGFYEIARIIGRAHGYDPSCGDTKRTTALMRRAGQGDVEGVELMLDLPGELVDRELSSGLTALACACRAGQVDVARLLVRRGADLKEACKYKYVSHDCVQARDPKAIIEFLATEAEHPFTGRWKGRTTFFHAIAKGAAKGVAAMLELGLADACEPDKNLGTPLAFAAEVCDDTEVIELLLAAGAPIHHAVRAHPDGVLEVVKTRTEEVREFLLAQHEMRGAGRMTKSAAKIFRPLENARDPTPTKVRKVEARAPE